MRRIEAEFEIVTPMFLGGADNTQRAELRVPSIKAALRFWWRMQAWSTAEGTTDAEKLKDIHGKEARIFGSADDAVGQSRFLMRLTTRDDLARVPKSEVLQDRGKKVLPGARYLGYGLMGAFGADAGKLVRPCIRHGQTFRMELLFRDKRRKDSEDMYENNYDSVVRALRLFGLLGGLGGRSRRGWGSVALLTMKLNGNAFYHAAEDQKQYVSQIKRFLGAADFKDGLPPHTALSRASRISLAQPTPALTRIMGLGSTAKLNGLECLAAVGSAMVLYRSNGKNRRIQLQDASPPVWTNIPTMPGTSNPRFWDDHQWYAGATGGKFHPERIVFGLPQNYSRRIQVLGTERSRRASPLLIHIHKLGGEFVAVLMVLPAQFLPENKERHGRAAPTDTIKLARDRNDEYVPAAVNFNILTDFIGSPYFSRTPIH
jgi:CRISPR-associated protein Cmr1